jgi:hypothetical protein
MEKGLYKTKWFDHRLLVPDQATVEFIKELKKAALRYYKRIGALPQLMDEDLEPHKGYVFITKLFRLDPGYLKKKNPIFWKICEELRQWADQHQIEYADFWSWAFRAHADLNFKKTFVNAFKNKRLQGKILEYQAEEYSFRTKMSDATFFRSENYIGDEHQKEYYDYLYDKIKLRHPVDYIKRLAKLLKEGKMSPDFIFEKFDHSHKKLLLSELESLSSEEEPISEQEDFHHLFKS